MQCHTENLCIWKIITNRTKKKKNQWACVTNIEWSNIACGGKKKRNTIFIHKVFVKNQHLLTVHNRKHKMKLQRIYNKLIWILFFFFFCSFETHCLLRWSWFNSVRLSYFFSFFFLVHLFVVCYHLTVQRFLFPCVHLHTNHFLLHSIYVFVLRLNKNFMNEIGWIRCKTMISMFWQFFKANCMLV